MYHGKYYFSDKYNRVRAACFALLVPIVLISSSSSNVVHTDDGQIVKSTETEVIHDNQAQVQDNNTNQITTAAGITLVLNNIVSACSINPEVPETEEVVTEIETKQVEVIPAKPYKYYYVYEAKENHNYYLAPEYQDYLYQMCEKYGMTEWYSLFVAQMFHESRFKPDSISKTRDYGLMQINKANHKWLSEQLGITDFLDPYQSMEAGVFMMSRYLEKYHDAQLALVCYNMGEGAVSRRGIHSSKYSRCVLEDLNKLIEWNPAQ